MTRLSTPLLGVALLSVGMAARDHRDAGTPAPPLPVVSADPAAAVADTVSVEALNRVVQGLCMLCHNDQARTGNLTLAGFDVAHPERKPDVAEKMIRKLRAGMMPPPGVPRPGGDTLVALVESLERRIDQAAAASPTPGSRTFQRLNREEYQVSIRELLGLEIDPGEFLPLDTKSANFDNIADVQMPSATLVEGYLRAAAQISRWAVGDPEAGPTSAIYKVPRTASQLERVEGAPIGTRGGVSVIHTFLADGRYLFQAMLHSAPEGELYGRTALNEQVEVSIDGERVALLDIDRWMSESDPNGMTLSTDSIFVRAGARRVTAAFLRRFEGPVDDLVTPVDHTLADTQIGLGYGVTTLPHLRDVGIVGPFGATGVSDTPSRRKIFTCRPTAPGEARPCAQQIVERLASAAYRRPLAKSDLDALMRFYDQGAKDSGFEAGVRTALQAILASPDFVFRFERAAEDIEPGESYRITDEALASRLSYFLWAAPPDQELIQLAAQKKLSNARTLELSQLPGPVDIVTIDVYFISLQHILPRVPPLLNEDADVLALVKPQFEAGRAEVGKKGVVRDPAVHQRVIEQITRAAREVGLVRENMTESPITGDTGNREFFLHLRRAIAAAERDIRATSRTRTTGEEVSAATWAVEAKPSVPRRPS